MLDHGTTNRHPVYPKRDTGHLRVGNNKVASASAINRLSSFLNMRFRKHVQ